MKLHSLNDVLRVSCAVLLDSCSPMDGYFTTIAALPECTEVLTLPRTALLFICLIVGKFLQCPWESLPHSLTRLSHRGSALFLSAAPLTGRMHRVQLWKHRTFLAHIYQLLSFSSHPCVRAGSLAMDQRPIQCVFPTCTSCSWDRLWTHHGTDGYWRWINEWMNVTLSHHQASRRKTKRNRKPSGFSDHCSALAESSGLLKICSDQRPGEGAKGEMEILIQCRTFGNV